MTGAFFFLNVPNEKQMIFEFPEKQTLGRNHVGGNLKLLLFFKLLLLFHIVPEDIICPGERSEEPREEVNFISKDLRTITETFELKLKEVLCLANFSR